MTNYLALYLQQPSRNRLSLDQELMHRHERDARWNGNEHIKAQLATAKRTATLMQKSKSQFSNLRAEHELAINAAVGALQALTTELTAVSRWAADYHAFFCRTCSAEEEQELEGIAQERWGGDAQALQFEIDLMTELGSTDGKLAFARWVHSAGKYSQINLEDISSPIYRLEFVRREYAHEPRVQTPRSRAAWTIRKVRDRYLRPYFSAGFGGAACVTCSLADYEEYLKYRQQVAATAAHAVAAASAGTAA